MRDPPLYQAPQRILLRQQIGFSGLRDFRCPKPSPRSLLGLRLFVSWSHQSCTLPSPVLEPESASLGSASALWCSGQCSKLVSVITSFFTSCYVIKWPLTLPSRPLQYPPSFDGRAVCYPSDTALRDYLSWRQADCEAIATERGPVKGATCFLSTHFHACTRRNAASSSLLRSRRAPSLCTATGRLEHCRQYSGRQIRVQCSTPSARLCFAACPPVCRPHKQPVQHMLLEPRAKGRNEPCRCSGHAEGA